MNPNQNSEAIWRRTRLQQALRKVDDEDSDGGGLEEAVVIDEQEFLEGIQNCHVEGVCEGGGGEREDKVVESVRSSCSVVSESGDTEKINVKEDEDEDEEIGEICSASKEGGDTEEMNVVVVEKEEEIGESGSEEYMRCLLEVLKVIGSSEDEDEDEDDDDDGEVDIIETAKRRGMTFPKSRFLS